MLENITTHLQSPLNQKNYILFFATLLVATLAHPFMQSDIFQAYAFSFLSILGNFYISARRLSDLKQNYLFALITLLPLLGFLAQVYLCFVETSDIENHKSYLKEKLA